jgi:hypothetical protein
MFASGWLYERPMLYVALGFIHMAGSIIYAVSLDKDDAKRRAFWCVNAVGTLVGTLCIVVWRKSSILENAKFTDDQIRELSDIDAEIFNGLESDSAKVLLVIGVMMLVTVLVSVVMRDLYYIDVILCAVPCIYSLWAFFTEVLTVFGGVVFTAVAAYFVMRIFIMISEPMRKPKVKKECQT